jgi:hypothetical protein
MKEWTMTNYETPSLSELGRLTEVTLGGPGSRCDGHSGNDGNHGVGGGGCENKTPHDR